MHLAFYMMPTGRVFETPALQSKGEGRQSVTKTFLIVNTIFNTIGRKISKNKALKDTFYYKCSFKSSKQVRPKNWKGGGGERPKSAKRDTYF